MRRPHDIENTASDAIARGYVPVPLRPGDKKPALSAWQSLSLEDEAAVREAFSVAQEFNEDATLNVGISLGAPSGGLVDVDLDHPRALTASKHFLPPTAMRSGRMTNPASHWWYLLDDGVENGTRKITLPNTRDDAGRLVRGPVIVELRATGGQTAIPPSIHPDGEPYEWVGDAFGGSSGPTRIQYGDLHARVLIIALVVTLAEGWPGRGSRHDAYLALAGMLLRERTADGGGIVSPVWGKNAAAVIAALADVTVDDDGGEERIAECIPSTLAKIRDGVPVQGYPTLARLMPEHLAKAARSLLYQIEDALGHERGHMSRDDYAAATDAQTVQDVPEHPDGENDPETGEDDPQTPTLLDLSNSIVQARVRSQVHELQVRDEARRVYDEARAGQDEVELDLQPLALVLDAEPDPEPRVQGFVPWNGGTLLVAQAKTGKTTMCLNMAKSLLTGEPFLGKFDVRPVEAPRNIALLNFEMSPAQMADWCLRLGLPRDRFLLLNQKGKGNPFRRQKDRDRLATLLAEWDVETLFVDTFAATYTGESQNDANEVRPWLESLLELSQGAGVNDLILTTHAGHDGSKPRGSTALADWADQLVFLTCEDPMDRSAPRFVHTAGRIDGVSKAQYTHDEVTLTQQIPSDVADLPVSTSVDLDPGPLIKAREALLEVLAAEDGRPLTSSELDKRVQIRSGVAREFCRSARYEATTGGWVTTESGDRNSKRHTLADDWEDRYRDAFPDDD